MPQASVCLTKMVRAALSAVIFSIVTAAAIAYSAPVDSSPRSADVGTLDPTPELPPPPGGSDPGTSEPTPELPPPPGGSDPGTSDPSEEDPPDPDDNGPGTVDPIPEPPPPPDCDPPGSDPSPPELPPAPGNGGPGTSDPSEETPHTPGNGGPGTSDPSEEDPHTPGDGDPGTDDPIDEDPHTPCDPGPGTDDPPDDSTETTYERDLDSVAIYLATSTFETSTVYTHDPSGNAVRIDLETDHRYVFETRLPSLNTQLVKKATSPSYAKNILNPITVDDRLILYRAWDSPSAQFEEYDLETLSVSRQGSISHRPGIRYVDNCITFVDDDLYYKLDSDFDIFDGDIGGTFNVARDLFSDNSPDPVELLGRGVHSCDWGGKRGKVVGVDGALYSSGSTNDGWIYLNQQDLETGEEILLASFQYDDYADFDEFYTAAFDRLGAYWARLETATGIIEIWHWPHGDSHAYNVGVLPDTGLEAIHHVDADDGFLVLSGGGATMVFFDYPVEAYYVEEIHSHYAVEILADPAPEPSSLLLQATALLSLAGLRRRIQTRSLR